MRIQQIENDSLKASVAKAILTALPEWFGIPSAVDAYVKDSAGKPFFCAYQNEIPVGFLYLKETGAHTAELAVMGVLPQYHRQGVGRCLFSAAKQAAAQLGYSFIQVKTVQMGKYDSYDATNRFYISLGFKELEVFKTLWDEDNPCQIYIMSI